MAKVAGVSVSVSDQTKQWLDAERMRQQSALFKMAKSAIAGAQTTVPRKTGALARSGRVETDQSKLGATAIFGNGNKVRYASVQERTQFRHYTTPGTGPWYLKNSGDAVNGKGIKAYL